MDFLKTQFRTMKEKSITFVSKDLYIDSITDEGLVKKKIKGNPTKEDIQKGWSKPLIDYTKNGCIIPLGQEYNLFCVDVDNKGDTVKEWNNYVDDHDININTFTLKTINKGYHYYYKLKDNQISKLTGFTKDTGKKFLGCMNIDLLYSMYSNGPSIIEYDGDIYKYKIINDSNVAYMPKQLFNDIYNHINKKNDTPKIKTDKTVNNNEYSKDILKLYLSPLTKLSNRDDWLKVGSFILNNGGTVNDFNIFSKQYPSYYDEKGLISAWSVIEKNKYKCDIKKILLDYITPIEYFNIEVRDTEKILTSIFKENLINDNTISNLYYSLYPNECIYDTSSKNWYVINEYGIYVNYKDDNIMIKEKLKKVVNGYLLTKITDKFNQIHMSNESDDIKEKQIKELNKLKDKINSYFGKNTHKNSVINECMTLYKKYNISNKFNNVNPYILGFNNGVYDLKNNIFRNALPEEYITITTGYDYKPLSDIPQTKINKMNDIINSIVDDPDEKDYILKVLSLGLIGENMIEQFYLFLGCGSNGKGVLSTFLEKTLGAYYDVLNIDYITKGGNIGKGQADPEMAKKRYCRIVVTSEPDGNITLKDSKLKELSGKDSIQCRELYKDPITFTPQFIMIILSNWLPTIDGSDGGMKRRFRLISLRNEFVDNPDPNKHNQRKRDYKVKSDYPNDNDFKLAFFHILKDKAINLMNDKFILNQPTNFKKDTDEYLNNNDPIEEFIKSFIIEDKTKQKGVKVKTTEVYKSFCTYCSQCNYTVVPQKKFAETMKKKYEVVKNSCMYYKHIELIDEETAEANAKKETTEAETKVKK